MTTVAPGPTMTTRDLPAEPARRPPSRVRRLWRGRPADPVWVRPSVLALLGLTAVLYLWDLSASGWANSYYAAAVQAGSASWKAWFFGSFDASNFITVDKTPGSLWVMGLSARIFGYSSWSMLAPQALIGVASVGLLYAIVRRVTSPAAGLLAGAVLALTPVATLMFRFNNPDALLVLLLIGSVYAVLRALEHASTRWLALAGVLIGFGYLTKMLQAFVLLPVLAGVYLLAAPTPVRRRLVQLLLAGGVVLVSAGWWVAAVALWPGARPYIGGSTDNSILELTLGYNGLGRLTGNETGSVGGGNGWGETGPFRLFNTSFGGQASWLIPAALLLLLAGLWATRRAPRTDLVRASLLLWGGWLVLTGLIFSFAQGIIHEYYTVALAPATGALVGIGGVAVWQTRDRWLSRLVLTAAVAVSAVWSYVLLARSPDWHPELRMAILVAGIAASVLLLAGLRLPRAGTAGFGALVLAVVLAGPAAASVQTAGTPKTGSIVTAGPAVQGGRGFGPGGGGFPRAGAFPGGGTFPGGGAFPGGGTFPGGPPGAGFGGGARGGAGGLGGLLDATAPSSSLVEALQQDASSYRWVAAAVGANSAAGVQLGTGLPVMAIGGFNGTDPTPTLAAFQAYVAAGDVHYFLASGSGGRGGPGAGSYGTSSAITSWVESTFTSTTIGGTTVYDLTSPAG